MSESEPETAEPEPEESEESDVELDKSGVIDADNDEPQEMGDDNIEVSSAFIFYLLEMIW